MALAVLNTRVSTCSTDPATQRPAGSSLAAGCVGGDKAGGPQKGNSFAAAAMAQAALNAMASTSSTDPLDTSPGGLTPTTPAAAAVVVQVSVDLLAVDVWLAPLAVCWLRCL